jgi:3-deoxy-D-manno-octulosonic-acid transferase
LHGPHVFNFADIYAVLDKAAPTPAISDAGSLAGAVALLLAAPRTAADLAATAARALTPLAGALDATMLALRPYMAGKFYSP